MTLPLELGGIQDPVVRRAFEQVSLQFPLNPTAGLGWIPTTSATLPTGTFNGQEFYYALAGGGVWHFKYNLSSAKWDFAGGPPLTSEAASQVSSASAAYVDIDGTTPSITLPFAGDYLIGFGATLWNSTANLGAKVAPKLGAAATADADRANHTSATISADSTVWRVIPRTGLAASAVIKLQYATAGGGTLFAERRNLEIRPIRVS